MVRSRKGFYRDNYNRVCVVLFLALATIFLLSMVVVFLTIFSPVPDFYATSMDGQLTRLVSLDSPKQASNQ